MDNEEIALRLAYLSRHGSPWGRLEVILANGLACVACASGSKVKPSDLLPKSPDEQRVNMVRADIGIKALARAFHVKTRKIKE